jgi:hypothetical protein
VPPLPRAACFTSRRGSTAVTDEPCQLAQIWFESLPRGRSAASTIDAHRVEGSRHGRDPRRTQDETADDVGQVVNSEGNARKADCQDHEHGSRDGDCAPYSVQDGQEDQQKRAIPDHRRLGVTAGKAQARLTGDRVGQDRTEPVDGRLDDGIEQ